MGVYIRHDAAITREGRGYVRDPHLNNPFPWNRPVLAH